MTIRLRTSGCSSTDDLHDVLKSTLELPDHYGMNLDALWDCLTGWVDLPLSIEWMDFHETEAKLGNYATKLYEVFLEAEKEIEGFRVTVDGK